MQRAIAVSFGIGAAAGVLLGAASGVLAAGEPVAHGSAPVPANAVHVGHINAGSTDPGYIIVGHNSQQTMAERSVRGGVGGIYPPKPQYPEITISPRAQPVVSGAVAAPAHNPMMHPGMVKPAAAPVASNVTYQKPMAPGPATVNVTTAVPAHTAPTVPLEKATGLYRVDFPDGSVYKGPLKNGVPHGEGLLQWPTGCTYKGGFSNGLFNGYGDFTLVDGYRYRGDWRSGMMHGTGEVTWSNGVCYRGGFRENLRQGEGQFCLPDGSVVKTQFANDMPVSDHATLIRKDGSRANVTLDVK